MLTSEHDDAPDALEGAVQLARASAQARGRAVSGGQGRVLRRSQDLGFKNKASRWMLEDFLFSIGFPSLCVSFKAQDSIEYFCLF